MPLASFSSIIRDIAANIQKRNKKARFHAGMGASSSSLPGLNMRQFASNGIAGSLVGRKRR